MVKIDDMLEDTDIISQRLIEESAFYRGSLL